MLAQLVERALSMCKVRSSTLLRSILFFLSRTACARRSASLRVSFVLCFISIFLAFDFIVKGMAMEKILH